MEGSADVDAQTPELIRPPQIRPAAKGLSKSDLDCSQPAIDGHVQRIHGERAIVVRPPVGYDKALGSSQP